MIDALRDAKERLAERFNTNVEPQSLQTDQWIANSLLQKAIRRGDTGAAQRAAMTFYLLKGSAIWRRLIVIAFEDVGAAAPEIVAMTVAGSTDAAWRKNTGGDAATAVLLARLLAEAPKSRSGEHLITTSNHHPSFKQVRLLVSGSSLAENLATVANKAKSLPHRALAAWCVSGIGWKREKVSGSDLPALLGTFRKLGVPQELVEATGLAATRSREAITLMVPLIWLAANDGQVPTVARTDVPLSSVVDDVPLYSLDKHTRVGREAVRNLVKYNSRIRRFLETYVLPANRRDAAYMAAFYADAAPLASRLVWRGVDELEALGIETDMLRSGVPPEVIGPFLELFRANVDHLNQVRLHTVFTKRERSERLGFTRDAMPLVRIDERT